MRPSLRSRRGVAAVALAVLLLVGASTAQAQDARVFNDVDTTLITVGDRVRMTVAVDHAAGARVVWPDSLNLAPFEVLAAEAMAPQTQGDRVRSGIVLTLTAFRLGEVEIPSFDVVVAGPGDTEQELSTDRFGIEVVSVGVEEGADIREIRGPLQIAVSVISVGLWLLGLLLLAVLAFWLYRRFFRSDEGQESGPEPEVLRPVDEVALEELDRLAASPMLERGQVKEFHIEVSEILRRYVEGRFGVPSLEMTTREVVEGLRRKGVEESWKEDFRSFLDDCDLVKFAKARPTADASRAVLARGRALVVAAGAPEPEVVAPEPSATEPDGAELDVAPGPSTTDAAAGSEPNATGAHAGERQDTADTAEVP